MELNGSPVAPDQLGALGFCNYGHFTSMRVENLCVRGLSLHLERLVRDCRTIFGADLDPERVRHLVRRVAMTVASPVLVRVTVFDPGLDLGHPGGRAEPHVLVSTRPVAAGALPALRLTSVRYRRELPKVKHVGLFGTIHHRRTAQLEGFDDVLFVDANSCISEGATWNIGFFDGSQVVWPRSDMLPGVTMHLLKDVLRGTGTASATAAVNIAHIPEMRCAFVTNAAIGVRQIRSVDDTDLSGDLPVLSALREIYTAVPGEAL